MITGEFGILKRGSKMDHISLILADVACFSNGNKTISPTFDYCSDNSSYHLTKQNQNKG